MQTRPQHFFNTLEQATKLEASQTRGDIFPKSKVWVVRGKEERGGGLWWLGIVLCLGGWWCCLPVVVMLARRGLLSPPEVSAAAEEERLHPAHNGLQSAHCLRPGRLLKGGSRVRLESVAVSKSEQISWEGKMAVGCFSRETGAACSSARRHLTQEATPNTTSLTQQ